MRTGIWARNLEEFKVSLLLETLGIVSAALGPRGQGVVEDQCHTTACDCPDIRLAPQKWAAVVASGRSTSIMENLLAGVPCSMCSIRKKPIQIAPEK